VLVPSTNARLLFDAIITATTCGSIPNLIATTARKPN
jgi:hypothetical protein